MVTVKEQIEKETDVDKIQNMIAMAISDVIDAIALNKLSKQQFADAVYMGIKRTSPKVWKEVDDNVNEMLGLYK